MFKDILEVVGDVLQEGTLAVDNEEDVYEADRIAREFATRFVEKRTI